MMLEPPARPRLPVPSALWSLLVRPVCFPSGRGFSGAVSAAAGGEAWLESTEQPPELMHMGGTSDSEFEVRHLRRWSCCPVRPQDFLPRGASQRATPRAQGTPNQDNRDCDFPMLACEPLFLITQSYCSDVGAHILIDLKFIKSVIKSDTKLCTQVLCLPDAQRNKGSTAWHGRFQSSAHAEIANRPLSTQSCTERAPAAITPLGAVQ